MSYSLSFSYCQSKKRFRHRSIKYLCSSRHQNPMAAWTTGTMPRSSLLYSSIGSSHVKPPCWATLQPPASWRIQCPLEGPVDVTICPSESWLTTFDVSKGSEGLAGHTDNVRLEERVIMDAWYEGNAVRVKMRHLIVPRSGHWETLFAFVRYNVCQSRDSMPLSALLGIRINHRQREPFPPYQIHYHLHRRIHYLSSYSLYWWRSTDECHSLVAATPRLVFETINPGQRRPLRRQTVWG